jgi:ribonuclease BN (tRNA processing enzyme)
MITVNFHGVRGSHPVSDAQMVRYGGNTSCVEIVKTNDEGLKVPIVVDAGSGLIKLGYSIAQKVRAKEYARTIAMLFTHFHHDHTEGFNFFIPIFSPDYTIHILGMEAERKNTEIILQTKMASPMFPVEYSTLKSTRQNHILTDTQVFYIDQNGTPIAETVNPLFEVQVMHALSPSHPQQGAHYYKIIDPADKTAIACVWDIESHVGGDVRVINFARGADVLIHDTQYTVEEYESTANPVQGYGHSTYRMAIENAEKAGAKRLITFHYSPRHNDEKLDKIAAQYEGALPFEFIMSYEGLSIIFDKGKEINRQNLNLGFTA